MPIGEQLRRAREARSLSLDQVAYATRIRLRYLEAMEAEKFDVLPSVTQLRGFLRTYADYLKLDSNTLMQALDAGSSGLPAPIAPPPPSETRTALTNVDAIFAEIGQKLQSQRELLGLSLDDVERHTHIRTHYVRALEAGDLSGLPSPVQGKGMLSNYATFLGLDTDALLLRFADGLQASLSVRQSARRSATAETRQSETSRIPARPSALRRLFSMDLFVGGILITFLLAFTIWGALRISALRSGQEPTSTAPPVSEILLSSPIAGISPTASLLPSTGQPTESATIQAVSPISGTAQVLAAETPFLTQPTPGFGTEPLQVYIVASQRAWMRVTVDGEVAFEGRVMPGSAYSFAGNERVELVTGDGGGLQVYFNQQDLGILGTFGEVVQRIFTLQGVQTPTPAVPPTSTPAPTSTPTPVGTPGTPSVTPTP